MRDIEQAIKLTGDTVTFWGKLLLLYEKQGAYDQASILAAELGKPDLAERYGRMQQMAIRVK